MPSKRNPLQNRQPESPLLPNQKVTYSEEYYNSLIASGKSEVASIIGSLIGHFGSVPRYPGFVVADFGRFGTYVGPLNALSSAEPHVVI